MSHVSRADEILVSRLRDTCAEIDRLRAELADMTEERNKWRRVSSHMSRLHDEAEAAIARVRELVRHYDPSDPGAAYYSRGDILHALDGGTE